MRTLALVLAVAAAALPAAPFPAAAQAVSETALGEVEEMIARGQLAEAEKALRSLPADPRADYLLGFTLIELYRFDEAERALRRAVDREPDRPAWLHALAKALQEQGKNLAAIEILDRAIAVEPRADFLFAKAMCNLNVGDLGAAEAGLRRSLELQPRHSEALYNVGRLLVDRGEYAAALDPLGRCLELQPGHLEARFLLGLAASRAGDLETARAAFDRVLAAVPGHVGALYNLGRVLMRLGRSEEAAARLEEFRSMSQLRDRIDFTAYAVKKNPENVDGRLELGRLLLEAGRTEEAQRELLAARRLAPGRAQTYRLLAETFRRLGRGADAERALQVARRLEAAGG